MMNSHDPTYSDYAFATRALHIGSEPSLESSSAVIPSISLSTTYAQSKVGVHKGFEYTRSSNPNRLALERVLASLEGSDLLLASNLSSSSHTTEEEEYNSGPAALLFSSGSAATATVLSALTSTGAPHSSHIVSVGDVYGGTARYMLRVAGEMNGVETTFVDMSYTMDPGSGVHDEEGEEEKRERDRKEDEEIIMRVEAALRPDTKVIWAETPTNPTLRLVPIALIASLAKRHGIPFVIDNTFSSPYYQSPLALGATIVVHSMTKYINGHSDVLLGGVATGDVALLKKLRFLQNANGNVPSAFDCWLCLRGIKTLSLRMRQHGLNALLLANHLQSKSLPSGYVRSIYYPGLHRGVGIETRSQRRERELAWDQMSRECKTWVEESGFTRDGEGGFPCSGMIAFHINNNNYNNQSPNHDLQTNSTTAELFLTTLNLFTLAESLGGIESLAELPLKMTHAGIARARRIELGIDGDLIRLSVGIEEGRDLVMDVERGLEIACGGVGDGGNGNGSSGKEGDVENGH